MSETPRIAICVGHSRIINGHRDGGAVSVSGIQEWEYNAELAEMVGANLTFYGLRWFIVDSYKGDGYGAAMTWLGKHLEERGAGLAVELHFNSAGEAARGHEWLYWKTSKNGERLANCLEYQMRLQFPPIVMPARGIKGLGRADRGAEFLRRTKCVSAICEPFFGTNEDDFKLATRDKDKVARAIANGIDEYIV